MTGVRSFGTIANLRSLSLLCYGQTAHAIPARQLIASSPTTAPLAVPDESPAASVRFQANDWPYLDSFLAECPKYVSRQKQRITPSREMITRHQTQTRQAIHSPGLPGRSAVARLRPPGGDVGPSRFSGSARPCRLPGWLAGCRAACLGMIPGRADMSRPDPDPDPDRHRPRHDLVN